LWPGARRWVLPCCLGSVVIDLAFVVANGAKLPQGAWFPLGLGIVLFTLLRTWRRGRQPLRAAVQADGLRPPTCVSGLMLAPTRRVPGTAIFMTSDRGVVPHAFMHNLKHNKVLHERNLFLTAETLSVPYAPRDRRIELHGIGDGFYRVTVRFGFMEMPDVPLALMRACDLEGLDLDPMDTTYFVGRETVVASSRVGMPLWRDKLF